MRGQRILDIEGPSEAGVSRVCPLGKKSDLAVFEEFDLAKSFLCLLKRFVRSAEVPPFA